MFLFVEHDTRVETGGNTRRVTFKHSRFGNKKGHQKDWTNSLRCHLEDEDVDMGASGFSGHKKFFKKGGGRPGSPAPRKGGKRKLLESPTNWFRVTVSPI